MGNFKYKLKEIKVGDVEIDKGTKYTVKSIDPETGSIQWSVEKVADFESALEELSKAKKFLDDLISSPEAKSDIKIRQIAAQVRDAFNNYRTHLRKNYPEEYKKFSSLYEESTLASNSGFTSGGEGENYATPKAFGKVPKKNYSAYSEAGWKAVKEGPGATMGPGPKAGSEGVKDNIYVTDFKYKLVNKDALAKKAKGVDVKKLWEADDVEQFLDNVNINDPSRRKFVKERIMAFDAIEDKLNQLIPLMQQAKNKTIDYYRNKPESYAIVYGTDLAQEYLDDLIELFKQE